MEFSGVERLNIPDGEAVKIESGGKTLWKNPDYWATDSDEAYQKTIPTDAVKGWVEKIGGKSIVWNQMYRYNYPQNFSKNNVTFTVNSETGEISVVTTNDGASELTSLQWIFNPSTTIAIANHKYLLIGCPSGGSESSFYMRDVSGRLRALLDIGSGAMATPILGGDFYTIISVEANTVLASPIVFKPRLFDLTQMFGAGNEPSTVEEFKAMFPDDYYEYNEGEILSAGINEVEVKDSDDVVSDTFEIPQSIQNLTGYGWSAGDVYNEVDWKEKKYIQRVGKIIPTKGDDWESYNYEDIVSFRLNIPTMAIIGGAPMGAKMICDRLNVEKFAWAKNFDCIGNSGRYMYVTKSNISTLSEFKDWIETNLLEVYYELAEPVITDISGLIPEGFLKNFDVEEGGTLTFKNQLGDGYRLPVPSTVEYFIEN